jgi:hypothetical protein
VRKYTWPSSIAANAAKNRPADTLASANAGTRTIESSSTGAGWRAERHTKKAVSSAAARNEPTTRASQFQSAPLISPNVASATAAIKMIVPSPSGRGGLAGSRISGRILGEASSAMMASGMLTMKIQCQLSSVVSRPPSGGPDAAPTAPIAAHAPIAAALRWGGSDGSRSPSEVGVTAAAPAA